MKKLILIISIVVALGFAISCENENSEDDKRENVKIEGVWEVTALGVGTDEETEFPREISSGGVLYYYSEFKDGVFTRYEYYDYDGIDPLLNKLSGTYTVDGDQVSYVLYDNDDGSVQLSDTLTVTIEGDVMTTDNGKNRIEKYKKSSIDLSTLE